MARATAAAGQTRVARDSGLLAIGSALNGLLAYVFFATVTRALGAEAAAPVSVLWAYWSFAAAALAFPLQHWAARSVTATGSEHAVRRSLPAVGAAVVTLGPVIGVLAWLVRDPLFHRGDAWFPVLVAFFVLCTVSCLVATWGGILIADRLAAAGVARLARRAAPRSA